MPTVAACVAAGTLGALLPPSVSAAADYLVGTGRAQAAPGEVPSKMHPQMSLVVCLPAEA